MKKSLIALLLFGAFTGAFGQKFEYTDPVTGAKYYTNQPKRDATQVAVGDELPQSQADPKATAEQKHFEFVATKINRRWPGACPYPKHGGVGSCLPRVGMSVTEHSLMIGLRRIGYVEDANGKVDRWAAGACRVTVKADLITSVAC